MRILSSFIILFCWFTQSIAQNEGYGLWLDYKSIENSTQLATYRSLIDSWEVKGSSPTLDLAKSELDIAFAGMLGQKNNRKIDELPSLVAGTLEGLGLPASVFGEDNLAEIGDEGFLIRSFVRNGKTQYNIVANQDIGILYGVYAFIKLVQTQTDISEVDMKSSPKIKYRLLNHWDNLNRTVERGYAGFSIWDWHKLPDFKDKRYYNYARANASVGINGTVLNNVNANALIFTPLYLKKVAALADIFRPYGIKVYLSARFSAPIDIGGLESSDPLDENVKAWWKDKVEEIYSYVPDFGGFLVKANSEGQPGPQNYDRTHADGANTLAEALAPHGGIVMWRAFVYKAEVEIDRHKQAFNEFVPLDGQFGANVMVQVKNGPIDFQPREPFHPLFGAMPETPLTMEFQITQEYLGFATHLVYLGTLFEEVLDEETYVQGRGSTVGKIIDGSLDGHNISGIAGVANIGTDRNWTGHMFGAANWYAFARLAWDHELNAAEIAEEWIRMTFTNNDAAVGKILSMMMQSRENCVNYMTPLGLHHIMGAGHHYGPAPWVDFLGRPDWNSVYYHQADSMGIGFDRTATGSNALEQYSQDVQEIFSDPKKCPDEYLLWFHHLPWDFKTKSGDILWDAICKRYQKGADGVAAMQALWNEVESNIDAYRFNHVKEFLKIQYQEAEWWREACLTYFQTFSNLPIPEGVEKPENGLEYYKSLRFRYAP